MLRPGALRPMHTPCADLSTIGVDTFHLISSEAAEVVCKNAYYPHLQ